MCEFRTRLAVEVSPDQLGLITRVIAKAKKELLEFRKYKCSLEEHIYVCGSAKALVKILPGVPGLGYEEISSRQGSTLSIIIESETADELVDLNNFFGNILRSAGIRYRRIE